MAQSIAIDESILDSCSSENVLTLDDEQDFDEWFLQRSLRQLVGTHSAPQLRWDVQHWVFLVPFVSREYAHRHVRLTLEATADRYREMVERGSIAHNPDETLSLRIRDPEDQDVAFRITKEFAVIPYRFSFEAVCLRLMVDPEQMREQIRYQMNKEGITQLIENNEMAVRDKREAPTHSQNDMFGVDYADARMFVEPNAVPGLVHLRLPVAEDQFTADTHSQSSLF